MESSNSQGESNPSFSSELDPSRLAIIRELRRVAELEFPEGQSGQLEDIERFLMQHGITQTFALAIRENPGTNSPGYPVVTTAASFDRPPYFYAGLYEEPKDDPNTLASHILVAEWREGVRYKYSIPLAKDDSLGWHEAILVSVRLDDDIIAQLNRENPEGISEFGQLLWAIKTSAATLADLIESKADLSAKTVS